jgi:alkylhydroperoxidase/carboxymuconolactone decarboxylase family protein YurZ
LASSAEIFETLGVAIYMGAGPSVMYAAHAIDAYKQFAEPKERNERASASRAE